jgi:hypothetical protein
MRYVLAVGILSFDLHVEKYPDAGRGRVEWRLAEDRPNRLFRESSGYWQLDAAPGSSVVTYAVATRTGVPGRMPTTAPGCRLQRHEAHS